MLGIQFLDASQMAQEVSILIRKERASKAGRAHEELGLDLSPPKRLETSYGKIWRPDPDSNRGITVLQTVALDHLAIGPFKKRKSLFVR